MDSLREKVEAELEQMDQALRDLPGVRRVGKLSVLEFWVASPRVHLGLACRNLQSKPNPQKSGVDSQGVTTIHQNILLPNRLVSAGL